MYPALLVIAARGYIQSNLDVSSLPVIAANDISTGPGIAARGYIQSNCYVVRSSCTGMYPA
jgi:hypothetical protein